MLFACDSDKDSIEIHKLNHPGAALVLQSS